MLDRATLDMLDIARAGKVTITQADITLEDFDLSQRGPQGPMSVSLDAPSFFALAAMEFAMRRLKESNPAAFKMALMRMIP